MSPLRLLRIWLLALVVVLVGCGGHDDEGSPVDLDASGDARRSDATTDRAGDAVGDARDAGEAGTDARVDTTTPPDVRVDTTTPPDVRVDVADARVDTATPDVRVDVADARVDTTTPDVRVDVADARVDTTTPDVRVDVSPDAPRDATADFGNDAIVIVDAGTDAGCSSDNQCGQLTPHCNTTTGQCVSRVAIAVTPANPTIAAGTTQQFAATMTYSDSSTGDVTALATWASSNTTVATVAPGTPGLATGLVQGATTISAIYAGLAAGTQLNVTMA